MLAAYVGCAAELGNNFDSNGYKQLEKASTCMYQWCCLMNYNFTCRVNVKKFFQIHRLVSFFTVALVRSPLVD